jgi:hypothetical protein
LAQKAWEKADSDKKSIRNIARVYDVNPETLRKRVNGVSKSKVEASHVIQRLSAGEEESLVDWIKQLGVWGWPPRVLQLRKMAVELLQAKGDYKELGICWTDQFFRQHPDLKAKFYRGLDQQRALASDLVILSYWFDLYKETIAKYNVNLSDIYNIDEKGILIGLIHKTKVIVSILEARKSCLKNCIQPGNREFVTLIECISTSGRPLSLWVTFKGKQQNTAWIV